MIFDRKVSVIIPIYNSECYLRQCLENTLNQTLQDIELICINDGSPDNCLAILHEYEMKDDRVVVVNQENKGVAESRNLGIKMARGEFIAFLDPDDFYPEKDVLEVLYTTAKKKNVKVCGGSMLIYKDGEMKSCREEMGLDDEYFLIKMH